MWNSIRQIGFVWCVAGAVTAIFCSSAAAVPPLLNRYLIERIEISRPAFPRMRNPVINNRGTVVYLRQDDEFNDQLRQHSGGLSTTFADIMDDPFTSIGPRPSLNNLDIVAFFVKQESGDDAIFKRSVTGGMLTETEVASTTGPFADIIRHQSQSINDEGKVVFSATLDDVRLCLKSQLFGSILPT